MVGTHQLVALSHVDNFVYLSCINQMVATHDGLVLYDRRRHVVEVIQAYQATTLDVEQAGLTYRLTDMGIVRRDTQFNGVLACRLEGAIRRLAIRQQTAHGDDRQHTHAQTEQARHGGGQDVHDLARLLLIQSADDEVWRCAYQGTHATHA